MRDRLILASSSPRRLELLRQVGTEPDQVIVPDVDERALPRELPRQHAERLAGLKAVTAREMLDDGRAYIVAADTVVACGRRILPKADNEDEARAALGLLSGRRHRVYTGLCALAPDGRRSRKLVMTQVQMKRLSTKEVERYLASGEWRGKAGGYAIQGLAARFIPSINGSYTNVVGLPVAEAVAALEGLGWRGA